MKSHLKHSAAGLAALLLAAAPAAQATGFEFGGELLVELQSDNLYSTDDGADAEFTDTYTTTEAELSLSRGAFSVNTLLLVEPMLDPGEEGGGGVDKSSVMEGESRTFQDHGLVVEALTLDYELDDLHLYAGKFGPHFSIAYDAAPGVYGTDMSEDTNEIAEMVGAGFAYGFGGDARSYTLSGSVFTADTSDLSDSVGNKRGRTREADGGPGNTGSMESFAVALDIEQEGLLVHLGAVQMTTDYLEDDEGNVLAEDDEARAVAAAEFAVADGLTALVEYAHFSNFGGEKDIDAQVFTVGGMMEFDGGWYAAASYTSRDPEEAPADAQFQVSGGYVFDNGLELSAGWKWVEEENVQSRILGLFAVHSWEL